jgi:hypothetical protein
MFPKGMQKETSGKDSQLKLVNADDTVGPKRVNARLILTIEAAKSLENNFLIEYN